MGEPLRRKEFLVKKGLQFKIALILFLGMASVAIAALFTVYLFNWKLISQFFIQRGIYVSLYDVFQRANLALISQLFILSLAIAGASIFVSHKIAGPVYRIERSVQDLIKDNLSSSFKLRRNDELQFLANSLDTFTGKLNEELKKERVLFEKLSLSLDVVQNELKSGKMNFEDVRGNLEQIKSCIDELKLNNAKFQLR